VLHNSLHYQIHIIVVAHHDLHSELTQGEAELTGNHTSAHTHTHTYLSSLVLSLPTMGYVPPRGMKKVLKLGRQ